MSIRPRPASSTTPRRRTPRCRRSPTHDHVYGGDGNDTIFAQHGQGTIDDCGAGGDTVYVNHSTIVRNCEHLFLFRRDQKTKRWQWVTVSADSDGRIRLP